MRGTNRMRSLIVSGAVVLLSLTILIGTTWALFTDTQTVTNHLRAGDLKITLKRTELLKTTLNVDGYLVTPDEPDKTVEDFTNPTDENVFAIGENEMIVPGTKYVAKMQIENHSDVAFGYWIQIACKDKTNGEDLAKQLKVTVTTDRDASAMVNQGLLVGNQNSYIDEIAIGKAGTFTVTVEFLDSFIKENGLGYNDNDLAQEEDLTFDLIVHAVQVTTARTDTP